MKKRRLAGKARIRNGPRQLHPRESGIGRADWDGASLAFQWGQIARSDQRPRSHTGIDRLPDRATDAVAVGQTVVKSEVMAAVDGFPTWIGHRRYGLFSRREASRWGNATVQRASEAASSLNGLRWADGSIPSGEDDNFVAIARSIWPTCSKAAAHAGRHWAGDRRRDGAVLSQRLPPNRFAWRAKRRLETESERICSPADQACRRCRGGVADAVAEETRIQGLTANGLKAAVDDAVIVQEHCRRDSRKRKRAPELKSKSDRYKRLVYPMSSSIPALRSAAGKRQESDHKTKSSRLAFGAGAALGLSIDNKQGILATTPMERWTEAPDGMRTGSPSPHSVRTELQQQCYCRTGKFRAGDIMQAGRQL